MVEIPHELREHYRQNAQASMEKLRQALDDCNNFYLALVEARQYARSYYRQCLRAEEANALLLDACTDALEWLIHAPLDYSNGVCAQGIDEGNVLGWRGHREVVSNLEAAIAKAKGETDGIE